ncbi:predicted protein [Lodderomyces elongisporus NRRL YB-4239]|uniref:Uncharacterized protein n=1 Tax=Lodderomyces elongisporus (strain ATCC 11503 / CBS 2605 / JCM 1781 / NBRC 1676 / NRRL YB-4239) TaxID=379508 RepID=A5DT00_LODEL|nr:predicted protein [Lodderomyces elongisporus NRRL YB-4239]
MKNQELLMMAITMAFNAQHSIQKCSKTNTKGIPLHSHNNWVPVEVPMVTTTMEEEINLSILHLKSTAIPLHQLVLLDNKRMEFSSHLHRSQGLSAPRTPPPPTGASSKFPNRFSTRKNKVMVFLPKYLNREPRHKFLDNHLHKRTHKLRRRYLNKSHLM